MAESDDDQDRTEQATPHKLNKAREQGQVAASREVAPAFAMILGAAAFALWLPDAASKAVASLAGFLAHADRLEPYSMAMAAALWDATRHIGLPLLIFMLALVLTSIGASLVQGAAVWSTAALRPKPERLSPLAGIKRLWGFTTLKEFLKNLLKLGLVGAIAAMVLRPAMTDLALLPERSPGALLHLLMLILGQLLFWLAGTTLALAGLDWFLARQKFLRDMRMSKKEIAEEHKEQEGDPHIKGKLKQMRLQRSRKRMMAEVPKATVVITNPSHYAVALRYDRTTAAPIVVAKGADAIAHKIRELAASHEIPVIESPPLARALYRQVELERPIPTQHYEAVAGIIAAIMRVSGKALR